MSAHPNMELRMLLISRLDLRVVHSTFGVSSCVSRGNTSPVILDHVAGFFGDHIRRCVRVTGDYRRHHTRVYNPETVDAVYSQPMIHHARIPSCAHFTRAGEVTQSCAHVTRYTSPICVTVERDALASRKRYRQQRGIETPHRSRGSHLNRLRRDLIRE